MRRALPPSTAEEKATTSPKRGRISGSLETLANTDEDRMNSGQAKVTIPRSFQTELVEQAKNENLIVCLPTGSGKTYIAVMLIKEMASTIRASIRDGGKRTIFLVKTVALVQQQSNYISIHTDLKVGKYYGELGVDLWNKQQWTTEFEQHQVLVFTAQVFLNLVDHNYFPLHKVNLLIFDECHHSTGENCYAALMKRHYSSCYDPPRILGLTASISAKKIKPQQLNEAAKSLESIYRARLTTGSDRDESNRCGTSARVERIVCPLYKDRVFRMNESISIPFDVIDAILNDVEQCLKEKKAQRSKIENDLAEIMLFTAYMNDNLKEYVDQSTDYTQFLQSENFNTSRLKYHLENLKYIGHELGIYGLNLAAKSLKTMLKTSQSLPSITNVEEQKLLKESSKRIDCLVDDILENLVDSNQTKTEILFSSKVLRLFERIKQDIDHNCLGRCIIFVERIYTATVLSKILEFLSEKFLSENQRHLKIRHLTGNRANIGKAVMNAKYQNQVIREFRTGEINVLVATAVVEEGLDIQKCNLVFRFNRPPNFSSYMQSKGRARDKQRASYVLLIDGSDETLSNDIKTYDDYEKIEELLHNEFSVDDDDDSTSENLDQLGSYRTENGAVISPIRAAQIIYEYCAVLGKDNFCPPRILFSKTGNTYKCILSMPASCPVREDITCEQRSKKLAKFECCLKMVKLLHQRNELNQCCLPYPDQSLITDESSDDENEYSEPTERLLSKGNSKDPVIYNKQINVFPTATSAPSNEWYLYKINIRTETGELGFIVPSKLVELPSFSIHSDNNRTVTVDIIYIKAVKYIQYKPELERFCSHLFENVIDNIIDKSKPTLICDVERSSFKLLPCLLTKSNEIDCQRMSMISNRRNKPVEDYSHLSDSELYVAVHLSQKQFLINLPNNGILKRTSDLWPHKPNVDKTKTYADYFQSKYPDIRIQKGAPMATMKAIHCPRINYLHFESTNTPIKQNVKDTATSELSQYYPMEFLRYAPVNQTDWKLFYKLPSLLVRLTQLYWIEQLRMKFVSGLNIRTIGIKKAQETVEFIDVLNKIKTASSTSNLSVNMYPLLYQVDGGRSSFLPLTKLTYPQSISTRNFANNEQPTIDVLFQAVTRRSTGEPMDNENLEVLGDSFLKLTVSMSLYYRHSQDTAGKLTDQKIEQISNKNLYRLADQQKLIGYLYSRKLVFRGEDANWLPPGYQIDQKNVVVVQQYAQQKAKQKAFSDMIEALIGAYLISTNYEMTLKFMNWLGLDVFPVDEQGNIAVLPSILRTHMSAPIDVHQTNKTVEQFFNDSAFHDIETTIKYKFTNKALLVAAFTHASNFANRVTDCYERLEFLGDAILDFLITRHIFVHCKKKITPGFVTDIRQDLLNNGRFAYILVACGLHKKIQHNSVVLFNNIGSYASDEDLFPPGLSTEDYLNNDIDQWADSTAPKALADIFEALIGAIFLDSGNSLEIVWQVAEPLLRNYIERSMSHPNLNPTRSFKELGGKHMIDFVDESDNKPTTVSMVKRPDGAIFEGHGANKKIAMANACRIALKQWKRSTT